MPKNFLIFAIGQAITALGSGLTTFGLGIWIYKSSGSISVFALGIVFYTIPGALASPIIGGLVDRYNRKMLALIADTLLAVCTLIILLLLKWNLLTIWVVYAIGAVVSIVGVLQYSAISSFIPSLVGEKELSRANGLISVGVNISNTLSPLIAGALMLIIGLEGVITIDLIAFLVGVSSYFAIQSVASPKVEREGSPNQLAFSTYIENISVVYRYISRKISRFFLILFMASQNFLMGLVGVLIIPLMLSMYTEVEVGVMQAVMSLGALVGAMIVSTFRINNYIKFLLIGNFLMGMAFVCLGSNTVLFVIYLCGFFALLFSPMIETCERSYWQKCVPESIQGRFFSIRAAIDLMIIPFASVGAGFMVQYVFEPAMLAGSLDLFVGDIVGSGEGRGIGFMFFIAGLLHVIATCVVMLLRYFYSKPKLIGNTTIKTFAEE